MNERGRMRASDRDKAAGGLPARVERRYRPGRDAARDPERRGFAVWPGQIGGADRAVRHRQIDAPAYRRACSSIPTPARSMSTGRDLDPVATPSAPRIRRTEIGFVYQFHHLLPEFSALENVMLPQMIAGLRARRRASARGEFLELSRPERAPRAPPVASFPAASSSASRSRARSPTRRASCWPTSRPAISIRAPPSHVFDALAQLVHASGLAAVIATHNMELAGRMDRRVTLQDGRVVELELRFAGCCGTQVHGSRTR